MAKKAKSGQSSTNGAGEELAQEIVVFIVTGQHAVCRDCGNKIPKKGLLRSENKQPHCMACAGLSHLVYLPRGDVALTRRARKHSTLSAIVVKWARGRNERQGLLVEEAALAQAERECLADETVRARARAQAAVRRAKIDERYVKEFAQRLGELYPGCPADERQSIAAHACQKYSGRVGRSAAAQQFDPKAMELALRAHIRHRHTRYNQLLAGGMNRDHARGKVRDEVRAVFARWRQTT